MARLLCIGDSITDCGRLFSDSPLGNGYVRLLSDHLHNIGFHISVENKGVDGFTVERLLQNSAGYLTSSPDMITIPIGVNDIGLMMNTRRTPSQQQQMIDEFSDDYQRLIQRLQDSSRRLLILEPFIFPCPDMYRLWLPLLYNMSSRISDIANRNKVPFIPLHQQLNNAARIYGISSVTTDGIHLTLQGHEILEKLLYPYIQSFFSDRIL